ncbi:MAG: copper-binding protein, partial [Solirubrobacterales bacterium]|nr:copper-binding protein [Solirubrobacterales bacterium]
LALSACVQPGPAAAGPSTNGSPIGFDLGGSATHPADPSAVSPIGATYEMHNAAPMGDMQMAHAGHVHAQASGTVNSVDAGARKVNISHGPIQALGWPPMTMDFPVAPTVDLKAIKTGSRVRFTLEKGEDGMPVILSISPERAGE